MCVCVERERVREKEREGGQVRRVVCGGVAGGVVRPDLRHLALRCPGFEEELFFSSAGNIREHT